MSKHKARQLCRQVQRALNLALAERAAVAGLDQLYVVDVTSELGCGHLLVHVSVPEDRSMPDVLASFRLEAPRLRAQVAGAISRKRAPELTFMPIMPAVPGRRWNRKAHPDLPGEIATASLSHPQLESLWRRQGTLEFGTLGSGNHFAELQADGDNRLWLMVHSGSRALGPAIRDHHLRRAEPVGSGLRALDANSAPGRDYLNDAMLAGSYAAANRRHIADSIGAVMASTLNATLQWELAIFSDHNHVMRNALRSLAVGAS